MEELLAGINNVDWHALEDCTGPADAVPSCFRNLLAGDSKEQRAAVDDLVKRTYGNGSLYSCAPPVYRFLIRLLADPASHDQQQRILDELLEVALLPRHTELKDFERPLHAAILEEIENSTTAFLPFLENGHPKMQTLAANLLTYNPTTSTIWGPAIMGVMQQAKDPFIRAELMVQAAKGVPAKPEAPRGKHSFRPNTETLRKTQLAEAWEEFLEAELKATEHPFVKFVAACLLVQARKTSARPKELAFLKTVSIDSMADMQDDKESWLAEDLLTNACLAAGRAKGFPVFISVLPQRPWPGPRSRQRK